MASRVSRGLQTVAATAVCLLAVLLISTPMTVQAWWDMGHMTVPEIALRHMEPAIVDKLQALVKIHSLTNNFPKSPDAVQAGPWADDIKDMGLYTMATWHFITNPYYPEGDDYRLDYDPVAPVNVMNAIDTLQTAVTNPAASVGTIAFSVVNIIHFVGDVHQPMHTMNEFSTVYPNGDSGGNAQTVYLDADKNVSMKLHMFWDSMGMGPQANFARPLSVANYQAVSDFANELEAKYGSTLTAAQKAETTGPGMIGDSNEVARTLAYPGISDGTVLNATYQADARVAAGRLVTLAGYRLAAVMNKILANVSMDTIKAGATALEATLNTSGTGNTYNYYDSKSGHVSAGATAGIAIATFCVGAIFAAAVTAAVTLACTRRMVASTRSSEYVQV